DIEVNQDEGWRGYGVGAIGQGVAPTQVKAERVSVQRAHEAGIVNIGATMELAAVHVSDTEGIYGLDDPDFPRDFAGRGISTQNDYFFGLPASTSIRGSVVERNSEIGIAVMGAAMNVAGTLVRDTLPIGGLFGRGIAVQHSPIDGTVSTAVVVDSHVADNHEIGISVTASQAELEGVLVEGTRAGGPADAYAAGILVEIDEPSLTRAAAEVRHGIVREHATASVLTLGSDLLFEHNLVESTKGQPVTGLFGDGLLAMATVDVPYVTVRASLIVDTSRAGVASFGGSVDLGGTTIDCADIDIAVSELGGVTPMVTDLGANRCGCGATEVECRALSTGLEPPEPPESL
ncbi:MAG: hypothetical protein JRI23_12655, partial [Deltaproteobacteria bacterium]|nr:hypothetical protein [Deltaproteobacteria bacterium]MBW2532565.1 hypothetical protein [Deltaproteobacteria bacterium]